MNFVDVKKKMMKLWKETFHDSDAYISMIFDEYFDPEFVEYHEEKNQLISALIGIPYEFGAGSQYVKALYLCGLATEEEFRHKGIMTELINRINEKAKNKGFVLSFLIPASDMLRIYYQNKGYVNGIYRVEERYTDIHDFKKDCLNIINREEDRLRSYRLKYYEKIDIKKLENSDSESQKNISEYIFNKEHESTSFSVIRHSISDIKNIINENNISGGEILFAKSDNEIKGVVFITFDERRRVIIPKIYYDDNCIFYKLLDKVKVMHSDSPMSIWRFPEETDRFALWSKVYGASNPDGASLGGAYGVAERVYDVSLHSQPYGMIKILKVYEILKYLAFVRNDAKFSILIKTGDSSVGNLYEVEAGEIKNRIVEGDELKKLTDSKDVTSLSMRDLSEILFRKKDGNSLIMEAFGIPRIAMNMALMLD